ncbi:MAG: DUF4170 domain-containing protein [Magnetovibrio sp.]|nr:DUF4170 domain-containing protein [Magnetovibrio sp.]
MTDQPKQLLHIVFGGRVKDPQGVEFDDLSHIDIVGVFPNNAEALSAWRQKSQLNVDDAYMKYVVVHMHRLLDDPEHQD